MQLIVIFPDVSYLVQPGFHLKQAGSYSFSCQKLSQISVKIYSQDDATEPIPSLLLSLSGDDGYRNNSMSGTGGIFVFENLFPGSFYLRPLLKVPCSLSSDLNVQFLKLDGARRNQAFG